MALSRLQCHGFNEYLVPHFVLPDCPSTVAVSPSSGPFKAGDVLTCMSDGYPQPSYRWTDSEGQVVSTRNDTTLSNSSFVLKCTATGNLGGVCSASTVIDSAGMKNHSVI